jgi:RecA/RadA recombinase
MIFPASKLNKHFNAIPLIKGLCSCFGAFGVGKTTFAIQTALNSLISNDIILFIYTKPKLPLKKLKSLSEPYSKHLTPHLSKKLKIMEISEFNQLLKVSFNLEFLFLNSLQKQKNISLIIIDSITDLYKLKLNPSKKDLNVKLNYQLHQILANLSYLNKEYDVEILLINERSKTPKEGVIEEVQSGGAVMDYWTLYRLKLERTTILNKRKLTFFQKDDQKMQLELTIGPNGFKPSNGKEINLIK